MHINYINDDYKIDKVKTNQVRNEFGYSTYLSGQNQKKDSFDYSEKNRKLSFSDKVIKYINDNDNNKSDTAVLQEKPSTDKKIELIREELKNKPFTFDDDRVFGYDFSGKEIREEIRDRLLSDSNLNDEVLQINTLDNTRDKTSQLVKESKYYQLGEPRLNNRTDKYVYICQELRDMPDLNGVRGKTPLTGKNVNGLKFKLGKIKESGINTIIDLRTKGECSSTAMNAVKDVGLGYVNFPVEDKCWTEENLNSITEYISAINSGDFYLGCANGQARTDLAVAINYVLNPKSNNVPELYFGTKSNSRVSVKDNLFQILQLVKNNKDIVQQWGWNNFDDFSRIVNARMQYLLNSLS